MEFLLMGAVVLVVLPVVLALRRRETAQRLAGAATVSLDVDDRHVRRTLADGRTEEIAWYEIQEVEVITTDVGVHKEDGVVLVLGAGPTRGCLVPSHQARAVIERLHLLPGFDARRLAEAMAERPPSRTSVWTRAAYPRDP
jgi:hypothetical protein